MPTTRRGPKSLAIDRVTTKGQTHQHTHKERGLRGYRIPYSVVVVHSYWIDLTKNKRTQLKLTMTNVATNVQDVLALDPLLLENPKSRILPQGHGPVPVISLVVAILKLLVLLSKFFIPTATARVTRFRCHRLDGSTISIVIVTTSTPFGQRPLRNHWTHYWVPGSMMVHTGIVVKSMLCSFPTQKRQSVKSRIKTAIKNHMKEWSMWVGTL